MRIKRGVKMKLTDSELELYKSIKELEKIWEVSKHEALDKRMIFEDTLKRKYGVYGNYQIDTDGNIVELYSCDRW